MSAGRKTKKAKTSEPRITKQYASRSPEENYPELVGITKACARCGAIGDGLKDFGHRYIRGKLGFQSYCRKCRSDSTPRVGS